MGLQTDTADRIVQLIRNSLNIDVPDVEIDLLDAGLIDSLALVMLIAGIEETFACELRLGDFDLDNFRSVWRIAEYLQSCGILDEREAW